MVHELPRELASSVSVRFFVICLSLFSVFASNYRRNYRFLTHAIQETSKWGNKKLVFSTLWIPPLSPPLSSSLPFPLSTFFGTCNSNFYLNHRQQCEVIFWTGNIWDSIEALINFLTTIFLSLPLFFHLNHPFSETEKVSTLTIILKPCAFHFSRFIDVPIESCGKASPMRVTIQASSPDMLLTLLR